MKQTSNNSLETRYIFYDGYNDFHVRRWLSIRGYDSRTTQSGAIYAWHPFLQKFKTVIRMREFVYIDSMSVCCVRADDLMQLHLEGKHHVFEIPDEELMLILKSMS